MRTVAVTLATGLFSALAFPAGAQSVNLTIWNLGNLHYETGVGTPGRPFALPRSDEDYNVLKQVAASAPVTADIYSLQEVNGPKAIARVFDLSEFEPPCVEERYDEDLAKTGAAAEKADRIYTAVLVRKGVFDRAECLQFPELSVIDRNPDGRGRQVRGGAAMRLIKDGRELTLLSVHMKSGCNNRNLQDIPIGSGSPADMEKFYACWTLRHHVNALEQWIDRFERGGKAFVIAGDFNRRFNRRIGDAAETDRDHFWAELDDHDPSSLDLEHVPREKDGTACWTGSFTEPIDFIAFNERAAPAIQAGTYVKSGFTQYEDVYKDLDESTVSDGAGHRNRMLISDHCPERLEIDFSRLEK